MLNIIRMYRRFHFFYVCFAVSGFSMGTNGCSVFQQCLAISHIGPPRRGVLLWLRLKVSPADMVDDFK